MTENKGVKGIGRREFLKLLVTGGLAAGGAVVGRELVSSLSVSESNFQVSLDTDAKELYHTFENRGHSYSDFVFVDVPAVLRHSMLTEDAPFSMLAADNRGKLSLLQKKDGCSVVVEFLSPGDLSGRPLDYYNFLSNVGWNGPFLVGVRSDFVGGRERFVLTHYICKDKITLYDASLLALSLPSRFLVFDKNKNPNSLFQGYYFGRGGEKLFNFGFAVLALDSDVSTSNFLGIDIIAKHAFREWVLKGEGRINDVESIVEESQQAVDPAAFVFENLCAIAGLTYRRVIDLYLNSSVSGFAYKLISSLDRGRIFRPEEIGIGFLNLSSFVLVMVPQLEKLDRKEWTDVWGIALDFFRENMMPPLPVSPYTET